MIRDQRTQIASLLHTNGDANGNQSIVRPFVWTGRGYYQVDGSMKYPFPWDEQVRYLYIIFYKR
jgi:hypothetical protein